MSLQDFTIIIEPEPLLQGFRLSLPRAQFLLSFLTGQFFAPIHVRKWGCARTRLAVWWDSMACAVLQYGHCWGEAILTNQKIALRRTLCR